MNLNDLKRQMLQQRRDLLVEQYKAAHEQRNLTLNATDKVTIDEMIHLLEQEMAQVEAELAALDGSSAPAVDGASSSGEPVWKQIGIEMIHIPAGKFLYGKDKETIFLDEFWIARTPVTNRQYEAFVNATGYERPEHWEGRTVHPSIAKHPVVNVSWDDALAFCDWASVHLPTGHQWEKAARGIDGREYPWGRGKPNQKRCNVRETLNETTPVGQYSPSGNSPYGLEDMMGNVWEWCEGWYTEGWRDEGYQSRGGLWIDVNVGQSFSCSAALISDRATRDGRIGFRVVS